MTTRETKKTNTRTKVHPSKKEVTRTHVDQKGRVSHKKGGTPDPGPMKNK